MEPEIIMLSEISHTQEKKYHIFFPHIWNLGGKRDDTKVKGRLVHKRKKIGREVENNGDYVC